MNNAPVPTVLYAFFAGVGVGVLLSFGAWLALWVISPWLRAFLSGGQISLFQVLGMRLRGTPVTLLIDAHLSRLHAGIPSNFRELEQTYLVHRAQIITSDDLVRLADKQAT